MSRLAASKGPLVPVWRRKLRDALATGDKAQYLQAMPSLLRWLCCANGSRWMSVDVRPSCHTSFTFLFWCLGGGGRAVSCIAPGYVAVGGHVIATGCARSSQLPGC